MIDTNIVTKFLNSLIPISAFQKSGSSKIFEQVNKEGLKIVIKNGVPTCILLSPDEFIEIQKKLDEYEKLKSANDNAAEINI